MGDIGIKPAPNKSGAIVGLDLGHTKSVETLANADHPSLSVAALELF